MRKSPSQAPIFFFPVSSFCPASIWSRSGRSENFPGRALTFSLSSSEHLVSQRTQCEKISRSSSHFLLPCFLFVQRAFGLTADAVRTFPVEHLHFLFRPASIWSHSGRSVRKSPGQAPIFLFPVSSSVQRALVSQRRKKAQTLPIGRSKLQLLPVAGQQGPSVQAQ